MVLELTRRYSGRRLIFDVVGKTGLKLMLSKTLKNMGVDDVRGFFSVNAPAKAIELVG